MDNVIHRPVVLYAEPDHAQQKLMACALKDAEAKFELVFADNSRELIDYLHRRGKFAKTSLYPYPSLVLTEVNLHPHSGIEVVKLIRSDADLASIPIIAFSSLNKPDKISEIYSAGISSYIIKPIEYADLIEIAKIIDEYWLSMVKLPQRSQS